MEIPEIGIITEFEAGMKCLQNPSFLSRLFWFSSIENPPQLYSFWKWGALIVALLATFTRLLKKLRFLILHIRRIKPAPESLLQHLNVDFDLTDDDDDDDDIKTSNVSSDDEEDQPRSPDSDDLKFYSDFRIKGSSKRGRNGNLRRRRGQRENNGDDFRWDDFTTGKNVVKMWDRLGLSLGFDPFDDSSDSESVVSFWDSNKRGENVLRSSATSSPAVVLSAKMKEKNRGVVLEAYDRREKSQSPAAYAEWGPLQWPPMQTVKVTSGGVGKVYVGDAGNRVVAVGDLRNLKSPLKSLTAGDGDLWWDADGDDEFVDCSR